LEATPRFGSPIVYLMSEIHQSPWGEFLKAIADGEAYDLKFKKGFGIVLLLAVPPFPYTSKLKEVSPKGLDIYFDKSLTKEDFTHIYFEGVAAKKKGGKLRYYISDEEGYVAYVTAVDKTVEGARKKIYRLAKHIYFNKMFYRDDIGIRFKEEVH